ncbi:ribosomal protein S18-alanine N-acetyltransferase [Flocculibacter collagenilyticus]|uniref:ribosomal protein S18-alanine N-acetyltransferase n=1 Tax=Flocculibacter collagenilyticus TaxID=2744479 RepID=UPI0018F4771B|nr:ribosomal protein S18-alanine N-acetyltransferase [Flocculibacter collagenilyticus]
MIQTLILPTTQFRALSEEDTAAVFHIEQQCNPHPWSLATIADTLSGKHAERKINTGIFSAEQLVGYYAVETICGEGTLMNIGVLPAMQGKGLGTQLMRHLLKSAHNMRVQEMWLEVRASNKTAIALYERMHFEHVSVRKGYYPVPNSHNNQREDAVIMKKLL